jgi:3-methyladenine DNA glycosylase/8-oxoguanine DNA glycosylase
MFLIFRLGRPDVLPELDLGIQNAIRRAYRLRKQPKPKDVLRIGKNWTPHASVASWYLWRSLEGQKPATPAKKRTATKRTAKKRAMKRAKKRIKPRAGRVKR